VALAEGFLTGVDSPAQAIGAVILASAVTLWCGLDAHAHGKLFLRSFAWALMFTWPVGAAVHFVWTRGASGLLTYALAGVLIAVASGVGLGAASVLVAP
jgi:hypothetical protein